MPENDGGKTIVEGQQHAQIQPEQIDANRFFEFIRRRTQELCATGMPEGPRSRHAMFEYRINQWPPEWGNELRGIIYGDFRAPAADLYFPDLGVVIEAGAVKESIARSATCVLKARVTVSEKSVRRWSMPGGASIRCSAS